MLKSHLDMIGRNEPITRKARFWQSYVRALKGTDNICIPEQSKTRVRTDDMRAPERVTHRPIGLFRPLTEYAELSSWPHSKSIYDDPIHAVDRIATPGYRYNPVSRETYGYSPRNIYPHHYTPSDRYRPVSALDLQRMYDDHNYTMANLGYRYPSRYPLILRYGPSKYTPGSGSKKDELPTAADILAMAKKPSRSVPRELEPAYNYAGRPIYRRGGSLPPRRPLSELFDPLPSMPMSSITRDPWWYEYPELRPYESPYNYPWTTPTPFYLRESYLSPIKRNYLWDKHPIRPFENTQEEYTEEYY